MISILWRSPSPPPTSSTVFTAFGPPCWKWMIHINDFTSGEPTLSLLDISSTAMKEAPHFQLRPKPSLHTYNKLGFGTFSVWTQFAKDKSLCLTLICQKLMSLFIYIVCIETFSGYKPEHLIVFHRMKRAVTTTECISFCACIYSVLMCSRFSDIW